MNPETRCTTQTPRIHEICPKTYWQLLEAPQEPQDPPRALRRSRQMAPHHEPGSAQCFYLLKGSFSLPLLPSAAHGGRLQYRLDFALYE